MLTVYGIKNCDSVRKTRRWLDEHSIEHSFHDFREQGVDPDWLQECCEQAGWQTLLNKRSTTWKQLDAAARDKVDAVSARELMIGHPTLIKRPVIQHGTDILVGFKVEQLQALTGTAA